MNNQKFTDKLARFERQFFETADKFTYIGTGSLGGKASGLAFIYHFLLNDFPGGDFPEFVVDIPRMTVLRTDIFDSFMQENNLHEIAFSDASDTQIATAFQRAKFPAEFLGDLRALIEKVKQPLAVRSSSLLEDALNEPFAGIYVTKMIPNNQHSPDIRFQRLLEAIKFVYASTYFKSAKSYLRAAGHELQDEKMAVIIQEVVGQRFNTRFYPHISGVARSYNFYPSGRAKPEDGVVSLALGLGKTIVDGEKCWTYSPAYPKIGPPFGSVNDLLKYTQTEFWAVNMGKPPEYDPIKETEYLVRCSLLDAEADGTLYYLASTLDTQSGRLEPGVGKQGPRVLDFSPILNLGLIPLNELTEALMHTCENALEMPVEIEFAVTLADRKAPQKIHRFGFLQVRPMMVSQTEVHIDEAEWQGKGILIRSEHVLGNGIIENIRDVVYVKPHRFDTRHSTQIAREIEKLNTRLLQKNKPYLLIGFGRWGSADPWLGIPVNWGQISGAKVIVEISREDINVEMSQGSHFFHNLISFQVCYFHVSADVSQSIDWDWLQSQPKVEDLTFTCWTELPSPLVVKVDGKSGRGIILKSEA